MVNIGNASYNLKFWYLTYKNSQQNVKEDGGIEVKIKRIGNIASRKSIGCFNKTLLNVYFNKIKHEISTLV